METRLYLTLAEVEEMVDQYNEELLEGEEPMSVEEFCQIEDIELI